jgi:hypothetical protein
MIKYLPTLMILLSLICGAIFLLYIWFGFFSLRFLIKVGLTYVVLISLAGIIYRFGNVMGIKNDRE